MENIAPPKISVIMAVKDGEQYLRQAIDSILAQTLNEFEFIIVDDYSSDNSVNVVQGYHDPRIRHIKNHQHLGLTVSLNRGLELARGEYIARMDADDISLPGRFEEQVHYLDHHPDVAVLGTAIRFIDREGNPLEDVIFPTEHDLIKWYLCFYNPIAHPTVMMRPRVIRQAGGYDPDLERSQDYDLWWRIGSIGRLANLNEIHVYFRKHANQVTSAYQDKQFYSGLSVDQKYVSNLLGKPVSDDIIQLLYTQKCSSMNDVILISEATLEILDVYRRTLKSKKHKQFITQDAAMRILSINYPFAGNIKSWPLIWKALSLYPFAIPKLIGRFVVKRC